MKRRGADYPPSGHSCQLSEMRVGSLAVTQLHSATWKARPIKRPRNGPRGATCNAVIVLVCAARVGRTRAKPNCDKAHG